MALSTKRLTVSLINGKANIALIKFLIENLDIKQSEIEIIAGKKGRNKIVLIDELDSETVNRRNSRVNTLSKYFRKLS